MPTGKAIRYSINNNGPRPHKSFTHIHTSNIMLAWLANRVWCTKFQSSLMNIYFCLSRLQSSFLLIYFHDSPNRCSHSTKVWHKNLFNMWHSTFEISAVQLRSTTKIMPKSLFLCVTEALLGLLFMAAQFKHSLWSYRSELAWKWKAVYLRGPCPPLAVLYTHVAISDYSSRVVWMVHVASWTWYTIMLWCYHVNSFCHGTMNYIAGIGSLLLLVEFELLLETLKKSARGN